MNATARPREASTLARWERTPPRGAGRGCGSARVRSPCSRLQAAGTPRRARRRPRLRRRLRRPPRPAARPGKGPSSRSATTARHRSASSTTAWCGSGARSLSTTSSSAAERSAIQGYLVEPGRPRSRARRRPRPRVGRGPRRAPRPCDRARATRSGRAHDHCAVDRLPAAAADDARAAPRRRDPDHSPGRRSPSAVRPTFSPRARRSPRNASGTSAGARARRPGPSSPLPTGASARSPCSRRAPIPSRRTSLPPLRRIEHSSAARSAASTRSAMSRWRARARSCWRTARGMRSSRARRSTTSCTPHRGGRSSAGTRPTMRSTQTAYDDAFAWLLGRLRG